MARWSPTRTVQTTVPTMYDALNELIDRGHQTVQRHRTEGIQDEQNDRARTRFENEQDREDLAEAVGEADAYEQGIRQGQPRQDPVPEGEDVFQGADVGMQRGRTEATRGSIFENERPGMAAGTNPQNPNEALAAELDGVMQRGRPREPRIVARAGEFSPELGGYADRNITEEDLFGGQLPGQPERTPRTRARDTDVALTEDRYLDTTATPDARAEREGQRDRILSMQERARLAQALLDMGATQEEAELVFTDDDYANEVMDRVGDRDRRFTEEELLAAGVPEGQIEAALRDPVLARQLISGTGEGGTRPFTPTEARTRATAARDQYLSGLIADGERDPQRLLEEARREYPDTPTTLRDIRAQLDAGEDERYTETRRAILDLVHPVEYGGGPVLNMVVEQLARGASKAQLETWLADAYEGEPNHPEYTNALSYLNAVSAAEGFDMILGGGG